MNYTYLTLNFDNVREFLKAHREAEVRLVGESRWAGIDLFLANKTTITSLLTNPTVQVRISRESTYKVGGRFKAGR